MSELTGDELERQVLALLQAEGRLTCDEVAGRLGAAADGVAEAMKKLHDDKVILGYQAIVDPDKTGNGTALSIIEVRVTPQRDMGFDTIAKRIYKFPEVKSCYLMSGAYDLLLIVEGRTLREVAEFVAEKLSTLEHVQSTTTHFLLRKYKEAGVLFHDDEEIDRLAISP
ncbi:Lrp/AsnC family transcriptional regulator [Candidatus Sumerlaeota bacterium]